MENLRKIALFSLSMVLATPCVFAAMQTEGQEEQNCAICQDSLNGGGGEGGDGEGQITTNCNHTFHTKCFGKLVMTKNLTNKPVMCPICRAEISWQLQQQTTLALTSEECNEIITNHQTARASEQQELAREQQEFQDEDAAILQQVMDLMIRQRELEYVLSQLENEHGSKGDISETRQEIAGLQRNILYLQERLQTSAAQGGRRVLGQRLLQQHNGAGDDHRYDNYSVAELQQRLRLLLRTVSARENSTTYFLDDYLAQEAETDREALLGVIRHI